MNKNHADFFRQIATDDWYVGLIENCSGGKGDENLVAALTTAFYQHYYLGRPVRDRRAPLTANAMYPSGTHLTALRQANVGGSYVDDGWMVTAEVTDGWLVKKAGLTLLVSPAQVRTLQ